MKKLIIAAVVALTSFGASSSQDKDMEAFNDAIVNAKFAGACGVYKQMVDFQSSTQMLGGDEFIERFGSTEVARLGMTIQEFTELCSKAINNYNQMNRLSK